jgi:hypothetical protein
MGGWADKIWKDLKDGGKEKQQGENRKWKGKNEHGPGSKYPRWGKTVHVVF